MHSVENIGKRIDQASCGNWILNGPLHEENFISNEDKVILRELAKKLKEYSMRETEKEKIKTWTAHNKLQRTRPLVVIDPENGWNELITFKDDIKCRGFLAGEWEMWLRKQLYYVEVLKDDTVIEDIFYVPYVATDTHHGLVLEKIGSDSVNDGHNNGNSNTAYVWKIPIENFETDIHKVKDPIITVDYEESRIHLELATEVFDGILQVKRRHRWWHSLCLTKDYAHLRGLENLLFDFYDYPDKLKLLLRKMTNIYQQKLDYLEKFNLLSPNTGSAYIGSGGYGFTDELRNFSPMEIEAQGVTTMDMWAHIESQETGTISNEMFEEFIFPFQKELAKRFGLVCYGCCEAVDPRWESIKTIPNLRRVSVSPWANAEKMAEYLTDKYLFSYKPNPANIAMYNIDEDIVREEARRVLRLTKNSHVEFIMKDNHTLGRNPRNASRFVEIMREEINKIN